mgnify:CR=1 FL=1
MGRRETIRGFILENFLPGSGAEAFSDGDSFMEQGIIDSTGFLELVAFLEKTYGFKIADEELIPDNLDSIDRILAFLAAKVPEP